MNQNPDHPVTLERLLHGAAERPDLYRRQFVAGPAPLAAPPSWQRASLGGRLYFSIHPDLPVTSVSAGQVELLFLGDMFDPARPSDSDREIAQAVAANTTSFETFEGALAGLSGRFLVCARVDDAARLYPDAAGLQPAFYQTAQDGRGLIGSQPRLINEFSPLDWRPDIAQIPNPGHFPFTLTPYVGVKPLLPNHYLDLGSRRAIRFWPTAALSPRSVEQAAAEMGELLCGTITAIAKRGSYVLPLSGGRDSRMLLAAFLSSGAKPRTATIQVPLGPRYDVDIPRRLSRKLGFPHEVVLTQTPSDEFMETLAVNTAGIFRDPSIVNIQAHKNCLGDVEYSISGVTAEVFRSFHQPHRKPNEETRPENIAKAMLFPPSPEVLLEIEQWLSDAAANGHGLSVWDMLYWEHRLGVWCSLGLTAQDTASRIISPFNNRRLFEIGLSTPLASRVDPYELADRICSRLCPAVLSEPFNTSFYDRTMEWLWPRLPYKIRRAWQIGAWAIRGLGKARKIREIASR